MTSTAVTEIYALSLHDALPILVTSLVARVYPAAEVIVRVFLSPEGAGAAKSAKGAGPQPGGGPSLVMVQTSGGGASSAQLWSRRRSPPLLLSTVFTQILEPAAGCCPLMVAVPFTMPTAGASSKLCVVFLPAAMVTASCSGSFTNTPPPPTCP